MESKKILIYAKEGHVTIVTENNISEGVNAFEPGKESTVGNSMYNLARVLNTCAKDPSQIYEIAVIGNVYSKVASPILKKEYYDAKILSTKAPLSPRELEVYSLVIQAMQKAYCNTVLMNMQYVPKSTAGKTGDSLVWATLMQKATAQYRQAPKPVDLDSLEDCSL